MEDKPAWPCPAVVSSQENSQWEEQPPGSVHECSMEMDISVLRGRTANVWLILTISTQLPHRALKCPTVCFINNVKVFLLLDRFSFDWF